MNETAAANQSGSRVLFWVLVVVAVSSSVALLWPFVPALLWASVLTILVAPLHARMCKRMPRWGASLVATLVALMAIVLPLSAVGTIIGVKVYAFAKDFSVDTPNGRTWTYEGFVHEVDVRVTPVLHKFGMDNMSIPEILRENRDRIGKSVQDYVARFAGSFLMAAATLGIATLTTFFLLKDGYRLLEPTLTIVPLPREYTLRLIADMAGIVRSVFKAYVVVAVIQGSISGITYMALGIPGWGLLWAVTILLSCLPFLGAPIIYIPLAISLFLEGKTWQAIVLLVVCGGIVSQIDNFLRPWFIGMGSRLHPMAIFFALLSGVLAFGPIGLMAGPMLLTLLISLAQILRDWRGQLEGLPLETSETPAAPGHA